MLIGDNRMVEIEFFLQSADSLSN